MYSDDDLNVAVDAGVLSQDTADALRAQVSARRGTPLADAEPVHYIAGYDEIFVVAAGIVALIGAGFTFGLAWPPLGGIAVAAVSWGIIEIFTIGRRMALPGIVFYGFLTLGIAIFSVTLIVDFTNLSLLTLLAPKALLWSQVLASALIAAVSWLLWLRARLPIAIAGSVAGIAGTAVSLVAAALFPDTQQLVLLVMFICGVAVFTYAMRWDMQDVARTGQESALGFWLHLSAAPLLVNPLFIWLALNVNTGFAGSNAFWLALIAVIFYGALAVVALIVDRRALLISGMIYLILAVGYIMSASSGPMAAPTNIAAGAMLVGVGLLIVAAFWTSLRSAILPLVHEAWRARVPAA
jgi:hypothetical protein